MAPPFSFADPTQILGRAREVTVAITKPKMRGLLADQIRRNLLVGIALSFAGGFAFKIFVADVRKARYAEFYRTYDAEKAFEEMRRKGLFQSC